MPKFTVAQNVESIIYDMKFADQARSSNRALIQDLFNGESPYSERQVQQNNIQVNFSDLTGTKISQDAQGQFVNAVFSPSQYFGVRVDAGPKHKRGEYSETISGNLRRAMKRGKHAWKYRQNLRDIFAQLILHGIGPMIWQDEDHWCPEMQAIADVLVPSQTLLTMENMPYFAVYRRYTAYKLWRMTRGPKVDPAWNMKVADKCIEWALRQWGQTSNTDYTYNLERIAEDFKSDGGVFNSDAVPTIDCWDFFYLDDDNDESGWKRRIVLDTPSIATGDYDNAKVSQSTKNLIGERGLFLYDSGDRIYASRLSEIAHWQFANGSMVAPMRYHSVRSLGWLLYSVCHLQNRLHCALTEAAFEACLQFFRVTNQDDTQRAIKIDLTHRGVIPDGVNFVPAQERWKVDANLIESVIALNRQKIADNSTQFTRNMGADAQNPREKTATQITAELQATSALLGAMLEQFYGSQDFQGREICRRYCRSNSKDSDVIQFRLRCLQDGIPPELLDVEKWDVSTERIMGSGNQQLAIGQAGAIMSQYDRLDPNAQRVAMRRFMFATTRDSATTELLAPEEPLLVTRSVHDAQVSVATLLAGQVMGLVQGVNHGEYAAVLIGALNLEIQKIAQVQQGVATPNQLAGLSNLAGQTPDGQPMQNQDGSPSNGAASHIAILSQDKGAKELVKQLGDLLSKAMNEVRAMGQRLQEQQQSQNGATNGQPEIDPETAVKLKGKLLTDQAKALNMRESHSQRAQQRQEIHAQKMQETQAKSELENANEIRRTQVDESAKDLTTAATISREALEPKPTGKP